MPDTDSPAGIPDLYERLEALEAKVAANQARLSALEAWGQQAATNLQRNVDAMAEQTRRERWVKTLRR